MTKRFRMAGRRFGCIKVCSSRNYSSKILVQFPSSVFVLLTSYSFASVVYAEDARELFISVVFCPIIARAMCSEAFRLLSAEIISFCCISEPRGRDRVHGGLAGKCVKYDFFSYLQIQLLFVKRCQHDNSRKNNNNKK